MTARLVALAIISAGISGCTSTPAGTFSYYLPKATTQLVVTQTFACNNDNTQLYQAVAVTPSTGYSSDLTAGPETFEPKSIASIFSDSESSPSFTSDGRLTGINTSSTGQGGEVLKDVVALAKAAALAAAIAPQAGDVSAACAIIATLSPKKPAGDDKTPATATLIYRVAFEYEKKSSSGQAITLGLKTASDASGRPSLSIPPDFSSTTLFTQLSPAIPGLGFSVEMVSDAQRLAAAKWDGASSSAAVLKLNSVAMADLAVRGLSGDLATKPVVWRGQVPVPLTAPEDRYNLPVPKAAWFGSSKFSLTLSEYGSIEKLSYSKGASADAADAAATLGGFVAGQLTKPTVAQQATGTQAEADLIYQQQRLTICRADPASCQSK